MRLLLLNGYNAFVEDDEKVLVKMVMFTYTMKYLKPMNCTLTVKMISIIYVYFTTIKKN